jgi:hypothetical protein
MLLARDDGGDGDGGGGGGGSSTGGRVSHPNRKTVRPDAMMSFANKGRIFILNHHGVVGINIYPRDNKDCN